MFHEESKNVEWFCVKDLSIQIFQAVENNYLSGSVWT